MCGFTSESLIPFHWEILEFTYIMKQSNQKQTKSENASSKHKRRHFLIRIMDYSPYWPHPCSQSKTDELQVTPHILSGFEQQQTTECLNTHWNRTTTLNYHWVNSERIKDIRDSLGFNENGFTTYPNLWGTFKVLLRKKSCNIKCLL